MKENTLENSSKNGVTVRMMGVHVSSDHLLISNILTRLTSWYVMPILHRDIPASFVVPVFLWSTQNHAASPVKRILCIYIHYTKRIKLYFFCIEYFYCQA